MIDHCLLKAKIGDVIWVYINGHATPIEVKRFQLVRDCAPSKDGLYPRGEANLSQWIDSHKLNWAIHPFNFPSSIIKIVKKKSQ